MPCISPDGKPTSSGIILLKTLRKGGLSPEEAVGLSGLSLPRVRSGLREMKEVGYVIEVDGKYELSKTGTEIIEGS